MKKLLIVSALCALLVPVSAFAVEFTNYSGVVKNGASVTFITTNGTKLTPAKTKLTGGIDHAILGAIDTNFNQEFRDTIIFNEGTLQVQGNLLASHGKASGPASFLFESSTQFIKGSAAVKVVGPNKKGKATVLITFLSRSVGFGNATTTVPFKNFTTAPSTLDAKIKLPAMQKKAFTSFSSAPLF
jgi:hypothetical protein